MPPSRTISSSINVDQGVSSSPRYTFTGPTSIIRGKACHQCRQRKEKCDGVRPICGRCLKRGQDCAFDNPEKDWGTMRQLTHHLEGLKAELASLNEEIDILKQVLEARNLARENMVMQDETDTSPDPHFLTYNQPSAQFFAATANQPHEDPESDDVDPAWDTATPVYRPSNQDPTFQGMDCTNDEDVPMLDLDSIIHLDRLALP